MLQEKDCKKFFNAILEEIEVYKKCEHWTLMNKNDMPTGAKRITEIYSFKRKRYSDVSLNKHKADYVLTADNKPGAKTTGILMHRSSHGLALCLLRLPSEYRLRLKE